VLGCWAIFTSWYRCLFCIPLTKAVMVIPLVDLAELIGVGVFISSVLLFQETWFGHALIIVPAMGISSLVKLLGVVPLLLFSTQNVYGPTPIGISPFAIYSVIRFLAINLVFAAFALQAAFSIYAIQSSEFYDDMKWGFC